MNEFVPASPVRRGAWDALPGIEPVRLEQLRDSLCKWPCGDPALFCGAPADPDRPYCAHHRALAYRPLPTSPRQVRKV